MLSSELFSSCRPNCKNVDQCFYRLVPFDPQPFLCPSPIVCCNPLSSLYVLSYCSRQWGTNLQQLFNLLFHSFNLFLIICSYFQVPPFVVTQLASRHSLHPLQQAKDNRLGKTPAVKIHFGSMRSNTSNTAKNGVKSKCFVIIGATNTMLVSLVVFCCICFFVSGVWKACGICEGKMWTLDELLELRTTSPNTCLSLWSF